MSDHFSFPLPFIILWLVAANVRWVKVMELTADKQEIA